MARDRFVPTIGEGTRRPRDYGCIDPPGQDHADRRVIVRIYLRRITLAAIHAKCSHWWLDQPSKEGSP
jgi:hypothetical protein